MAKKYLMDITTLTDGVINANNCNAILFKNNCINNPPVAIVNVNGMPVYEQQMLILSGHEGEVDITDYNVTINLNGGTLNNFQVIRKYYINDNADSTKPLTQNTF